MSYGYQARKKLYEDKRRDLLKEAQDCLTALRHKQISMRQYDRMHASIRRKLDAIENEISFINDALRQRRR